MAVIIAFPRALGPNKTDVAVTNAREHEILAEALTELQTHLYVLRGYVVDLQKLSSERDTGLR